MKAISSSLQANRFSPYKRAPLKQEVKDEDEDVELQPAGPIPHFGGRIGDWDYDESKVKDENEESTWEKGGDSEIVKEEDEEKYSQRKMVDNPGNAVSFRGLQQI